VKGALRMTMTDIDDPGEPLSFFGKNGACALEPHAMTNFYRFFAPGCPIFHFSLEIHQKI
jgi:hypothetical protein